MAQNALLDFLQAASNAAASNVSGPVDIASWLLNKAGLKIKKPFGGSEWMAERGLTKRVENPIADAAGQTFGMVAPIGIAAKAPQIAAWRNAVNELAESGAGRMPLASQRGAVVYHGSPHKFDKFDSSKIGTGEGAQAYGHGLYLAENQEIAGHYAKVLPGRVDGADWYAKTALPQSLSRAEFDELGALGRDMMKMGNLPAQKMQRWRELHDRKQVFDSAVEAARPKSNLYKVDLPDEMIARMLDWDKPLSQQAPEVQKAVEHLVAPIRKLEAGTSGSEWGELAKSRTYDPTGREILSLLRKNNKSSMTAQDFLSGGHGPDVSDAARQLGIPGIRYLDGNSRGVGSGSSNYVVFPGEENALRILARNGGPLP